MCSGERSSSANGAIARRASAARSWSTSSSRVLSDWTMRGPSFTVSFLLGAVRVYGPSPGRFPGSALLETDLVDPVDREGTDLVAALVVRRELSAADLAGAYDPLGRGAVVVQVADPD